MKFNQILAVCHTIIVEYKDGDIQYNASSPDELALTNAARFFGIEFSERNSENTIIVNDKNEICFLTRYTDFPWKKRKREATVTIQNITKKIPNNWPLFGPIKGQKVAGHRGIIQYLETACY